MKVWNGTAFVDPTAFKVWNGSAFVNPELYTWNGTSFDKVWPSLSPARPGVRGPRRQALRKMAEITRAVQVRAAAEAAGFRTPIARLPGGRGGNSAVGTGGERGGAGANGSSAADQTGGNPGAGGGGGGGNNSGSTTTGHGGNGGKYGGGGGGSGGHRTNARRYGGAGGDGYVLIEWE
ncbi:minor tail protein [Mycobacterium phage LOCARD]|nr:minor tail protein [Mycobacterium phage LOCARD]